VDSPVGLKLAANFRSSLATQNRPQSPRQKRARADTHTQLIRAHMRLLDERQANRAPIAKLFDP